MNLTPQMPFLVRLVEVDPAHDHNVCVRTAATLGHLDVVHALLEDTRVDVNDDCGSG